MRTRWSRTDRVAALASTLNKCYALFNKKGGHMALRTRTSTNNEEHIALKRNRLVLEQARAVGLLGEAKDTRLSGRVPAGLVEAAKKRAHVSSDTELLELALSRLALEDDFGARLVRRKGSVPAEIDLAI